MSMLDRFALNGGVAVVTGAGRGIGEGIALGLAEAGCDVVLTARRENEIEAVARAGPGTRSSGACRAWATSPTANSVDQLADRSKQEMGKVTLWVSNAGGADDRTPRHLADMPDRQWDYQMDLNLRAVFTGARAAARVVEDGGSIINISSGAALKPSPNNGPYAVAKGAGVDSLTRTMSTELAPRGIRVNGVAPGPGSDRGLYGVLRGVGGGHSEARQKARDPAWPPGYARGRCERSGVPCFGGVIVGDRPDTCWSTAATADAGDGVTGLTPTEIDAFLAEPRDAVLSVVLASGRAMGTPDLVSLGRRRGTVSESDDVSQDVGASGDRPGKSVCP